MFQSRDDITAGFTQTSATGGAKIDVTIVRRDRARKGRILSRFGPLSLAIAALSALTASLAGCAPPMSDLSDSFVSRAKKSGYRCVETVPPAKTITELRTCQDGEHHALKFAVFTTEEAVKHDAALIASANGPAVVSNGTWMIAGDEQAIVEKIAKSLGAPAS